MGLTASSARLQPVRDKGKTIGTVHLDPNGADVGFGVLWQSGALEISLDGEIEGAPAFWIRVTHCDLAQAIGLQSKGLTGLEQVLVALGIANDRFFVTAPDGVTYVMEIENECC